MRWWTVVFTNETLYVVYARDSGSAEDKAKDEAVAEGQKRDELVVDYMYLTAMEE